MKSITKIWLVLLTALTVASFTAYAQADSSTTTTNAPAAKPKPKGKRYNGKIASIDKDAKTITFTMASGTSHTLKITSKTRIKKDGEDATLDDATVGEHVSGTERQNEAGDWVASTVNIGHPKPKAATPPPATPPPADSK